MSSKKKYQIIMILAMASLYFFSFLQRVAIPGSIFNELQSHYSMSAAAVTRLSAIYLFIYALMQPFVGYLADRFGGIKVVLASGVLLCIGSLLFPFSDGTRELYLSRALVGVGASAMYLCLVKETSHYFSNKNFAPILGGLCFIGYSGGLIGTRPFRTLVELFGWQNSCISVAVATSVVLLFTGVMMTKVEKDEISRPKMHILQSITLILKNKLSYPLLLTTPFCFSLYFTIQATIGPKILEDLCGMSSLRATNYTFIMMLCTIISMLFSGVLSRIMGNKRKYFVVFYSISTFLSMLLLLAATIYKLPSWVFLIAYVLPAISAGFASVTVSLMKELNQVDNAAVAVGILNTVTYSCVAIMSQFTGKILDVFRDDVTIVKGIVIYPQTAYITLFTILLAVSIIPFAASFFCRETNGENIYDNNP